MSEVVGDQLMTPPVNETSPEVVFYVAAFPAIAGTPANTPARAVEWLNSADGANDLVEIRRGLAAVAAMPAAPALVKSGAHDGRMVDSAAPLTEQMPHGAILEAMVQAEWAGQRQHPKGKNVTLQRVRGFVAAYPDSFIAIWQETRRQSLLLDGTA